MTGNALIWRGVPTWGILALIAVLLLARLSDRLLWGDEAETALLARNILKFGVPTSTAMPRACGRGRRGWTST
jgi:hypothetical protein